MEDGWLEGWVDCTGTASYLILDAQPKGVTGHTWADVNKSQKGSQVICGQTCQR